MRADSRSSVALLVANLQIPLFCRRAGKFVQLLLDPLGCAGYDNGAHDVQPRHEPGAKLAVEFAAGHSAMAD